MITVAAPVVSHDEGLTLAQRAYRQVKELIVTLAVPPGSTLRETELQRRLGVGRTPLREALHRLAQEGMLHIYPRRAIVVAKLGMSEVRQIFEVRLALEAMSAALAAQRMTEREKETLLGLGAALHRTRDETDVSHFLQADQAFHRAIAQYAQNGLLVDQIDHLLTLNLWLWNTYFATRGARGTDLFAHEPIIEALTAGNAPAAETTMREHILHSKEQLLAGL